MNLVHRRREKLGNGIVSYNRRLLGHHRVGEVLLQPLRDRPQSEALQ